MGYDTHLVKSSSTSGFSIILLVDLIGGGLLLTLSPDGASSPAYDESWIDLVRPMEARSKICSGIDFNLKAG